MKYFFYLFLSIAILSCKTDENKSNLIYNQLVETNNLLKSNNKELYPLIEQIFYKRCKHTNNFRNEANLVLSNFEKTLTSYDKILKQKKISEKEWKIILLNYTENIEKLDYFISSKKEWKINGYEIYTQNYESYNSKHFPESILKLENDILLNKSALYDFILFYSICKHKPSQFLQAIASDNKLNISSTNKFSFQLTCNIPDGKDKLEKQISNLEIIRNGETIKTKPEIRFFYSDTAKIQAIIRFSDLESGEYTIKGNYILKRLNLSNLNDTIMNILPFSISAKK